MSKAARAIIINADKLLVMHRNKYGSEYFTLVGGLVGESETAEEALKREVKEETGLEITKSELVFIEEHSAPHNSQYIYFCEVTNFSEVAISQGAEENKMNKLGLNTHELRWASINSLASLQFRTPQLQKALVDGFKNGFPAQPVKL